MSENLEKFGSIVLEAELDVQSSISKLNECIRAINSSKSLSSLNIDLNIKNLTSITNAVNTIRNNISQLQNEINNIREPRQRQNNNINNFGSANIAVVQKSIEKIRQLRTKAYNDFIGDTTKDSDFLGLNKRLTSAEYRMKRLLNSGDNTKLASSLNAVISGVRNLSSETDRLLLKNQEIEKQSLFNPDVDMSKQLRSYLNGLNRQIDASVNPDDSKFSELHLKVNGILEDLSLLKHETNSVEYGRSIDSLTSRFFEVRKEVNKVKSDISDLNKFERQAQSLYNKSFGFEDEQLGKSVIDSSGIKVQYELINSLIQDARLNTSLFDEDYANNIRSQIDILKQFRSIVQDIYTIRKNGRDPQETLNPYKSMILTAEEVKNIQKIEDTPLLRGGKLLESSYKDLVNGWKLVTQQIQVAGGEVLDLKFGINSTSGEVKLLNDKLGNTKNGFGAFFNEFRSSFKALFRYFINSAVILGFFRQFKTGVKDVVAVDDAIRELKKVTEETDATYRQFAKTANSLAISLGHTTESAITSTADFAKLGYSFQEAQTLAKNALIYSNVGDMDIDDATQSLVSTMKAFGIEAENSMHIIDAFNEVGNKFSITSEGIGEALKRGASALAEGGNTLEESIGIITGANSVLQDPDIVGTALKTLSMRLRGVNEENGELIPKMREFVMMYSNGIDIMKDESTFKSTTQILRELAAVWGELSDVNRAAILNKIAGQRQGNAVAAILNNFKDVEAAITAATNSFGSAAEEQARYMDSITAKTNEFKETLKGFWIELINTDFAKKFVSIGTSAISVLKSITETFSGLGTVGLFVLDLIVIKTKNTFKNVANAFKGAFVDKSFIFGDFAAGLGVGGWTAIGTTVVTSIFAIIGAIKQAEEERRKAAAESAVQTTEDISQLGTYKKTIDELQGVLKSHSSTYDEIKSAKEQLLSIQDTLIEKYGLESGSIDLVNGSLKEQLELIDGLARQESDDWIAKYRSQGEKAIKELNNYKLYSSIRSIPQDLRNQIESNTGIRYSGFDMNYGYLLFNGSAEQTKAELIKLTQVLDNYKRENKDKNTLFIDSIRKEVENQIVKVENSLTDYGNIADTYRKSLILETGNNDLYDFYNNATDLVNKYNQAVNNADLNTVSNIKDQIDSLSGSIGSYLHSNGLDWLAVTFIDLFNQIDKTGTKALQLDSIINSLGKDIFSGLSDKDLFNGLGGDAFESLRIQAEELGYSVEDLIQKLIDLNMVQNSNISSSGVSIFYKLKDIVSDTTSEGKELQDTLSNAIKSVTEEWRLGTNAVQEALDTINQMLGLDLTLDGTGTIETLNMINAYLDGGIEEFGTYLNAAVKALGVKPDASSIKNTITTLISMLGTLTGSAAAAGNAIIAALTGIGAVKEVKQTVGVKPQYSDYADSYGLEGLPSNVYTTKSVFTVNDDFFSQFGRVSGNSKASGGGSSTKSPYEYDFSPYEKQQKALESIEYQLKKNEAAESAAGDNMAELLSVYEERANILEQQRQAYNDLIKAQTDTFNNETKLLKEKYGIDLLFDPNTGKLVVEDYGAIKKAVGSTNESVKKNAEAAESALKSAMDLGQSILDNAVAYDELTSKINDNSKALKENDSIAQNAKFKELFNEFQSGYLQQIEYVIEDLKYALDNDSILSSLDTEIESLEKRLEILNDTNEAEQKALELEKQKEAYENAKRQRTNLIYRKGQGFVWEADPAKLKDESDKLSDKIKENERYNLELQLKNLQTLRSEREKFYQDQIDAIQKLYDHHNYLIGVMARETPMTLEELKNKFAEFGIDSASNLATVCAWAQQLYNDISNLNNVQLNPIGLQLGKYASGDGIITPFGDDYVLVEEPTWEIPMYANGTLGSRSGFSIVGENGPELRVLNSGDGILPTDITKNLWEFGKFKPSDLISSILYKLRPVQNAEESVSIGEVHVHEVKDGYDFCNKLANELPLAARQILFRRR